MTTTIRLSDKTKALLANLKIYPRETYEDVIKRLINYQRKEEKLND